MQRVLLIDDRPVRRTRIGSALQKVKAISVIGIQSCAVKIPDEIFTNPPDFLLLPNEIADRCNDSIVKFPASAPAALLGLRRLVKLAKFETIRYDDDYDIDIIIRQLAGKNTDDEQHVPPARGGNKKQDPIVVIGSSTGGVDALTKVLKQFPAACPPTLIVQHMKASFTAGFANRLNTLCLPEVAEATDGEPLKPGKIYIAPGGKHLEVINSPSGVKCRVYAGDPHSGHLPSVDVLFNSLAYIVGPRLGVILTGMGKDGANGLLELNISGARTIGQDETSSVVYGMPRVAFEIGAVDQQLPLHLIGDEIIRICNKLSTVRG